MDKIKTITGYFNRAQFSVNEFHSNIIPQIKFALSPIIKCENAGKILKKEQNFYSTTPLSPLTIE